MISIKRYEKPSTIDEAYEHLVHQKKATLIGGGAFLKLGSKQITTAIDLSEAGLTYIKETDEAFEIGATTTFHQIETHLGIKGFCSGMLSDSVKDIVGIQMRNMVTLGGTVYSRYGFSDLITALLALKTEVQLFKQGNILLEEFLEQGSQEPDILKAIIVRKSPMKGAFQSMRKSKADYAVLNLAVSQSEDGVRIAVGARPNRAKLAHKAMHYLNHHEWTSENIEKAGVLMAEELIFGSNMRGTADYRKTIAPVLLKRALQEVMSDEA